MYTMKQTNSGCNKEVEHMLYGDFAAYLSGEVNKNSHMYLLLDQF